MDDGFTLSVVGTADPRGDAAAIEDDAAITFEVAVGDVTDASGRMLASFIPDTAGSYVMRSEYTGSGGLLATFFRTSVFSDPVLENTAHFIEVWSRMPELRLPLVWRHFR